ncbi:hypothetical protein P7K49_034197 [Saguinus oedipus]|uniref:Uncharacterized protein n=1 Tax=Saguinus oedipus TaxID=9490 RepID=A0ABQ9TUV9_SAGOE|nr:hypothetical protein P7K49_034197 [Saguinus oedipus]
MGPTVTRFLSAGQTRQPHLQSPAGRLRTRTPARTVPPRCLRGAFLQANGYARLLHIRAFPALDYISHRRPGGFRTLISGAGGGRATDSVHGPFNDRTRRRCA